MRTFALLAACLALQSLPAAAGSSAPDPLDARTPVPPALYVSPLARYRGGEAPAVPWREANDRVARIGGWRTYAREAAPPAEPASAAAPTRHPHGGPR